MRKVNILLSTYNGEQFLEEQLQSLISQKGVDTDILVRDDGSTDSTRELLERWQNKGLLTWYGGENMGWAMSFMHLLTHAHEADYYAFCDQDDIWQPDKLSRAVEMIEKQKAPRVLYCSNMNSYRNGKNEGPVKPAGQRYDIHTAMVKCLTVGCTMVLDKALAEEIRQHAPEHVPAHDFWVYQVASAIGTVCYDEESHMLYRQHDHNQIGLKRTFREVWRRRLKTLHTFWHDHSREEMARQLLRLHGNQMNDETRKAVALVAGYRRSPLARLRLFSDRRYTMGHLSNDVFLRMRILLGRV